MGKKRKKKKYSAARKMELVCIQCKCLWRLCDCSADKNTDAWILVNGRELEYYFETGLVPDHASLILCGEGQPQPDPIPLEHPPVYGFKI